MTWMDLLHLLEQQPYMELNKELSLFSIKNGERIDYEIAELAFPSEFGDFDGNVYWKEWLDSGMTMQICLKPVTVFKKTDDGWVTKEV